MPADLGTLKQSLISAVGAEYVLTDDDIGERYRIDITKKYKSKPAFMVRPASSEELAGVVRAALAQRVSITVVGGQTSTVGSAIPVDGGIAVSLERMNRIIEIDAVSMTMTVEAGCFLQVAQETAEKAGTLLPLDLGARGSAMIGGVIGTNAGGNRVLRWGMMRDMVIGLEAVLADGTIISSLTKMLKDNAGYNWKHLLIGSEGTLGIVTRAVLRIRPLPTTRQTALVGAASFDKCVETLRRLEVMLSGRLSSFEVMWDDFYGRMSEAQLPLRPRPLQLGYPIYALVESMGGDEKADDLQFERVLGTLLEEAVIEDAVIAKSDRERQALWAVREDLQLGLIPMRPFRAYDVSMAVADMPGFVSAARKNVAAAYSQAEMIFYGHAGDGNLHAIATIGAPMDDEVERKLDTAIYDAVRDVGGSISAEHGVGKSRAAFLSWTRSERELALMRAIKQTFDPHHILNPGNWLG